MEHDLFFTQGWNAAWDQGTRLLQFRYVIDLESREVVATVTGVGNDPYGVAVVYR